MNHIFGRLCVGTANWGKEYNGAKVSEDDQKRILDYCQCSGIDMIDTAESYGWDWTEAKTCFDIIVKTNAPIGATKNYKDIYCVMSHKEPHGWYITTPPVLRGASLYSPDEFGDVRWEERIDPPWHVGFGDTRVNPIGVIQIPYSIYDRRFGPHIEYLKEKYVEIHVRSIFLRGKILEKFNPQQCISFCLMNPNIDKVIIGADSYKQFKENLRPFHDMNVAEKHDINLLDPRKWK